MCICGLPTCRKFIPQISLCCGQMVLNSAPQILTVFRLTECTLFREVLERCKWEKPILGGASGRPPSPCRYETHSPSSWKMLKGPLSSLYSGSISHSNKVQRRALCQFWKTVTGQYVVGRIHRHETELSPLGLDGVGICLVCSLLTKGATWSYGFLHLFHSLKNQFNKGYGICRTFCSISSLPPRPH